MKKRKLIPFLLLLFALCSCNQVNENETIDLRTVEVNPVHNYIKSYNTKNHVSGGFSVGNYKEVDSLVCYRVYTKNLTTFTSLVERPFGGNLDSCLVNNSEIGNIYEVDLSYKSEGEIVFSYSTDYSFDKSIVLPKTKDFINRTILLSNINYIKVSSKYNADILSLDIKYDSKDNDSYKLTYSDYRIDVNYDNFDCKDLEKRSIPIEVKETSNGYEVVKTKEYTYYSTEYLINNYQNKNADSLALTDPLDVANYLMLFHDAPVNYYMGSNPKEYEKYFSKSKIRKLQQFSGTYGYARSVPYEVDPSNYQPLYYELDIDVNGTYDIFGSRSSGRLVYWVYGFTSSGYEDSPVVVYTSDHYATFSEFNNAGRFVNPFDAELDVTGFKHTPLKTLNNN